MNPNNSHAISNIEIFAITAQLKPPQILHPVPVFEACLDVGFVGSLGNGVL